MMLQGVSREDLHAVLAFQGQFRHRLLYREVPGGRCLGDFDATVGAGRVRFVAESRVREQMCEARRAHQVPVTTLQCEPC